MLVMVKVVQGIKCWDVEPEMLADSTWISFYKSQALIMCATVHWTWTKCC